MKTESAFITHMGLPNYITVAPSTSKEQGTGIKRSLRSVYCSSMVEAGLFTVFEASLPAQDLMIFLEYRAARVLNVATPPALAVVGWLGNAMVVHVLACSSLRRTACFPYLAAIACLDCGVLLCNLLFNFVDVFVTALRTSNDVCRLHYFLFFVCSHLSAWLLVAVTAQRYFVVCRPLRALRVTSLRCTCWVIGGLVAGCVGLNTHHLVIRARVWNNGTGRYTCQTLSTGSEIFTHEYWPWVDALAYCFVPSLLLIVLNTAIVRTLYRAAAFRNKYQLSFSNYQSSVQSHRLLRRNSLPASFLGTAYNHYQNHHRQHFLRSALSGSRTLVRGGARGQTSSQEVVCQTVKNQSRPRHSQHLKATFNKSCPQWNHSCYSLSLVSWISEVPESEIFIENVDSGRQPHLHQGRKQSVSLPHLHHTATKPFAEGENFDGEAHDLTASHEEVNRAQKEHHVTLMPLLASIVFVMLSLPIAVVLIVEQLAWTRSTAHDVAVYTLVRVVVGTLMLTNHAINFALYCFAGSTFRRQWRQLYCRASARGAVCKRHATASRVYSNFRAATTQRRALGNVDNDNGEETEARVANFQHEDSGGGGHLVNKPACQQQPRVADTLATRLSQKHYNLSYPRCIQEASYATCKLLITPSSTSVGKRNSVP